MLRTITACIAALILVAVGSLGIANATDPTPTPTVTASATPTPTGTATPAPTGIPYEGTIVLPKPSAPPKRPPVVARCYTLAEIEALLSAAK